MHLRMPGDKSISHRALMLAALAEGTSRLVNLSPGTDVAATRRCLEQCGIHIREGDGEVLVAGRGGVFGSPEADLDAGNSGTTARLLAGLLAGRDISGRIVGDQSLSRRPMRRIADPLIQMGANLRLHPRGTLPLVFQPARLSSLDFTLPVPSAQVKSALLLAGLASEGPVTVTEPIPTRDHTERMLKALGVDIHIEPPRIIIGQGPQNVSPFEGEIPGDPSSAAFLAALALLLPGRRLAFDNLLLNPTRLGFFQALKRMDAQVEWAPAGECLGEKVGTLTVRSSTLKGIHLKGADIPGIIDELPILAVLATQAEGPTLVEDAHELRVKESDRIKSICRNLRGMRARIDELEDGFRIIGPRPLRGANIMTGGDHRIAMAFAVAGHVADRETVLDQPECAAISFPDFFSMLGKVAA